MPNARVGIVAPAVKLLIDGAERREGEHLVIVAVEAGYEPELAEVVLAVDGPRMIARGGEAGDEDGDDEGDDGEDDEQFDEGEGLACHGLISLPLARRWDL
jgi:hypothetical protein